MSCWGCFSCNSWKSSNRKQELRKSCMEGLEDCFDASIRITGPLYILLALVLMCGVIYVGFATLIPAVCPLFSWQGVVHSILTTWLSLNIFYNYYYCIFTDPGTPPVLKAVSQAEVLQLYGELGDDGHAYIRWCKKCRKPKPPMTHHCQVCGRCVLKMDHHCPWMANCIGFHNYRYFFVFLAYLWLGCFYAAAMASVPLYFSSSELEGGTKGAQVIVTFVLALAVLIALSILFGWHLFLVATAQTSIEFHVNKQRKKEAQMRGEVWRNKYNLGGVWRNCMGALDLHGTFWCCLLLLPGRPAVRGDGVRLPVRPGSEVVGALPGSAMSMELVSDDDDVSLSTFTISPSGAQVLTVTGTQPAHSRERVTAETGSSAMV